MKKGTKVQRFNGTTVGNPNYTVPLLGGEWGGFMTGCGNQC